MNRNCSPAKLSAASHECPIFAGRAHCDSPDPDLIQALEENRVVMYVGNLSLILSSNKPMVSSSQTERIGILRQALDKHGIVLASNAHYDLPRQPVNEPPQPGADENEDRGVYL
jgi:hypothetical protein